MPRQQAKELPAARMTAGAAVGREEGTADIAPLQLHDVTISAFKSYGAGPVVAGPFGRQTTIVGPNGAGKSCLVEGICFALGVQSPSQAPLAQLVNRSAGTNGAASVAVRFRAADPSRSLVVERRIVGGKRSEWRLQLCDCEMNDGELGDEPPTPPWVCSSCETRVLKRDTLRESLRGLLHFDINRPERLVVHQSMAVAVASKTAPELLEFLEGVVGTEELREGVQREAARALALQGTLAKHEEALATARLSEGRHAPAMVEFRAIQASRARLEETKSAHLKREMSYHTATLRAAESAAAQLRVSLDQLREESKAKTEAVATACSNVREHEQAAARARSAVGVAQRALARIKDENAKLALTRKQQASAEARHSKSMAALRAKLIERKEEERESQMEHARTLAAARELKEQLDEARAALAEREAAMNVIEGSDASTPEPLPFKRKSGRGGGADGASVGKAEEHVLRLESELRRVVRETSGTVGPARLTARRREDKSTAERLRLAEGECTRLEASKEEASAALSSTQAEAAAQQDALCEAKECEREHTAQAAAMEHTASEKQLELDGLHTRLAELQTQLDALTSKASTNRRAEAIRYLRASEPELASEVDGFLCELLTVDPEHSLAVNAALGGVLRGTIVVRSKPAALRVVRYFSSARVGVITCLILDELSSPNDQTKGARSTAEGCVPLEKYVSCAERHRPVVSRLLGRWSLAQSNDVALDAFRRVTATRGEGRRRGGDVVTLLGECFLSSGEIRQAAPPRAADSGTFSIASTLQRLTAPSAEAPIRKSDPAADGGGRAKASIEKQAAALQERIESIAREARTLRVDASAQARAASKAADTVAQNSLAAEVLGGELRARQGTLDSVAAKLRAKLNEVQRMGGTRGDEGGDEGGGHGIAGERIHCLREETARLRAALASAADESDEEEGRGGTSGGERSPAVVAVPWHTLHAEVLRLGSEVEENTEAKDTASWRVRDAVSGVRTLSSREKTLAQQLSTAQRALGVAVEKESALATRRATAEAQVKESVEERDARAAEGPSLIEARDSASEELAGCRRALRRAETAYEAHDEEMERQREALALLRAQMKGESDGSDAAVDGEAEAEEAETEAGEKAEGEAHDETMEELDEAAEEEDTGEAEEEAISYAQMKRYRLELSAQEQNFSTRERALDLTSLEEYLKASARATELAAEADATRGELGESSRRVETLQAERSRAFLRGLEAIDAGVRTTFRALCKHGDCSLEYATQPVSRTPMQPLSRSQHLLSHPLSAPSPTPPRPSHRPSSSRRACVSPSSFPTESGRASRPSRAARRR